jgi:hypothetical protein
MEYVELARALIDLAVRIIGLTQTKALIDDLAAVQRANEEADRLEKAKFG